ncbi:MAG: response regulator [Oscillospiraceae bacterium]|jgi:CheY-like chemotaxis protein|nr:response regulator [Oscillospiraceae bacterium]
MSVRKRIFIPMIALSLISCVALIVAAKLIYDSGINLLFLVIGIGISIITLGICLFFARYTTTKIETQVNKLTEARDNLLLTMDTMIMVTEIESDKIMYMNERFMNELRLSKDDIGKTCWKVIVPNSTERCSYCPKIFLKENSVKSVSWEHKNPNTKRTYRIISRYIDWADGVRVFIEQCFDMTEEKEMLKAVEKARDEAMDANNAKTKFLANMSHEIRTPMNSIIGFSELALDEKGIPVKTEEHLENILNSAESLLEIIDNVLDISKIEAGNESLVKTPLAISGNVCDVAQESHDNEVIERPQFTGEVLIFEDNALNQQVLSEHLSKVGLSVQIAENGKIGVDIIKQRLADGTPMFDLIFMDIRMPVMDGVEATVAILRMGVKVPIIALTANIMSSSLQLYKENGITETLGKPFKAQDLWKCLKKYLAVVDYNSISKDEFTDEDTEMIEKMQRFFVRNNQTTYDDIKIALNAKDFKKAHMLIHSLKSNAGYINETRLQKTAAEAEALLAEDTPKPIDNHMKIIKVELYKILKRFSGLLEDKPEDETAEKISDDEVTEIFNELEVLLRNRDTESFKFLTKLKGIPNTKTLISQIESYNFKDALETLSKLNTDIT